TSDPVAPGKPEIPVRPSRDAVRLTNPARNRERRDRAGRRDPADLPDIIRKPQRSVRPRRDPRRQPRHRSRLLDLLRSEPRGQEGSGYEHREAGSARAGETANASLGPGLEEHCFSLGKRTNVARKRDEKGKTARPVRTERYVYPVLR